jgi:hypothetical protein
VLAAPLGVSNSINTLFVERNNATDRRQNGRKQRKTYGFSRAKEMHDAATYFVSYSYNFCWPVRTLRVPGEQGWQARTPAMAAGLTDHVWSLREWLTYPAKPCLLVEATTRLWHPRQNPGPDLHDART